MEDSDDSSSFCCHSFLGPFATMAEAQALCDPCKECEVAEVYRINSVTLENFLDCTDTGFPTQRCTNCPGPVLGLYHRFQVCWGNATGRAHAMFRFNAPETRRYYLKSCDTPCGLSEAEFWYQEDVEECPLNYDGDNGMPTTATHVGYISPTCRYIDMNAGSTYTIGFSVSGDTNIADDWYLTEQEDCVECPEFGALSVQSIVEEALEKPDLPDLTEAYLINLDRRPDRLAECEPEFAKAGYRMRRFAAVDGNQVQPYPAGFKAGGGALGCKLSHVAVLRDALDRGLDQVTVFEDDVVFTKGYQTSLAMFLDIVPDDWQAIFLGGQHKKPPVRLRAGVGLCVDTHRTHAYIVRGDYIKTLLDLFEQSDTHIDHTWGHHQVKEMPKIYCPFPNWLCGQRAGKSDINGRQLGERYWTAKNAKTPSRPVAKNRPMCECGRLPKLCCGKPCHSCQMDRIKSIRAAAGR